MTEKQKNKYENEIDQLFGWLPKSIVEGEYGLSAKAKGILLYLNNRPDDWTFYKSEVMEHFSDGRTSINNGLDELQEKGFLQIDKIRNPETGQWEGQKWTVKMPDNKEEPPESRNPYPGEANPGKPPTNNNNDTKTEGNKKEIQEENTASRGEIKDSKDTDVSDSTTLIEPRKDEEAVSIFLNLFEDYSGLKHYPLDRDTYYEATEKLSEDYYGLGEEDFTEVLIEYFEDFDYSGKRLPRLEYFNKVRDRYFKGVV